MIWFDSLFTICLYEIQTTMIFLIIDIYMHALHGGYEEVDHYRNLVIISH